MKDKRGIHLIHASKYEADYWLSKGCKVLKDPDYPDFRLIDIGDEEYLRVYGNDLETLK